MATLESQILASQRLIWDARIKPTHSVAHLSTSLQRSSLDKATRTRSTGGVSAPCSTKCSSVSHRTTAETSHKCFVILSRSKFLSSPIFHSRLSHFFSFCSRGTPARESADSKRSLYSMIQRNLIMRRMMLTIFVTTHSSTVSTGRSSKYEVIKHHSYRKLPMTLICSALIWYSSKKTCKKHSRIHHCSAKSTFKASLTRRKTTF